MALNELNSSLKGLKSKINDWAVEAIQHNKGFIVNIVKYNQLSRGIRSDGGALTFDYLNTKGENKKSTGRYSAATQQIADDDNVSMPKEYNAPYNFSWTGETLDEMYLQAVNKESYTYDISSKTSKVKKLESIYGEIFDLTDEHNNQINELVIVPYIFFKMEQEFNNIAQRLF